MIDVSVRMRTVIAVDLSQVNEFLPLVHDAVADSLAEVADPDCGTRGYSAHFDPDSGRLVLWEHHDSYRALIAHLSTNPARRARLRTMCSPAGPTEIYGHAPPELVETLRSMQLDVQVFPQQLGVSGVL